MSETLAGLPSGTAICSVLPANGVDVLAAPASTTACMVDAFADANTSAGAPCTICSRNEALPARFSCTSISGFAASKAVSIPMNASVSDDAAMTSTVSRSSPPEQDESRRTIVNAASAATLFLILISSNSLAENSAIVSLLLVHDLG